MLLKFIRKHTKLIFIVVLSLMIIPFLFWGVGSIGKQRPEKEEPIRVRGRNISAASLGMANLDSQIRLLIDFVEVNNIKTAEQFEMYKDWFNQLINQMDINKLSLQQLALEYETKKYGISVSKDELVDWIGNFPLFQINGIFDTERYNTIVANYFRTWPNIFEKALSRILAVKKLQKFIMDTVLISKNEAYEAYKEKNEKVTVFYVEFNTQDFIKSVGKIEEIELKDYYEKHKEEFREPEKIKIAYLLFDPADFESQIAISQKEIEDYYEENKNNFKDKDGNLKSIEDVKDEIKKALTTKKAGELCQEKGLEASIDLTEEKRLGDMIKLAGKKGLTIKETEFISREQTFVPELGWTQQLLQTAWRMDIETISDLLHAGNKWVIISPKERKQSRIPELEEVKDMIKDILKNKHAEELAYKTAEETLKSLPKDVPFTKAVKSLKLKPKKSKPITRDNELFSKTIRLIKTPKGTVLVSMKQLYPIDNKKWEKEKEVFTTSYLEEKKRKFFQSWLNNLL